jgi:hypothetical protein
MTSRTTCQPEIRTKNRRAAFYKYRKNSNYRRRVKELTAGQKCIICGGTERLTIHHINESDYKDTATYLKTLDNGVVMCNSDHRRWHNGKTQICPICKKTLIAPEYERCWNCITDEEKEQFAKNKEFWRDLRKKWSRAAYEKIKAARAES